MSSEGNPDDGASGDDTDRYVHDPSEFEASSGSATRTADTGDGDEEFPDPTPGMGRRGWVLLAAVVLAFFGAPAVIYLRPPAVPFEVAFLVVPLVPAFLLGMIAVWAMAGRGGR